jgi:hypothetical protein
MTQAQVSGASPATSHGTAIFGTGVEPSARQRFWPMVGFGLKQPMRTYDATTGI